MVDSGIKRETKFNSSRNDFLVNWHWTKKLIPKMIIYLIKVAILSNLSGLKFYLELLIYISWFKKLK